MDELEFFVSNLKRDKARGTIAPHQILLLISFYHLYNRTNKYIFEIKEIDDEFQKNWNLYKSMYQTTNRKLGMPLKALYNKKLLSIDFTDVIVDFRNLHELQNKISYVKFESSLIEFLKLNNVENFLISKIAS